MRAMYEFNVNNQINITSTKHGYTNNIMKDNTSHIEHYPHIKHQQVRYHNIMKKI